MSAIAPTQFHGMKKETVCPVFPFSTAMNINYTYRVFSEYFS
ncbi:4088_t:CDS:1, partial [Gigaspora rosea]